MNIYKEAESRLNHNLANGVLNRTYYTLIDASKVEKLAVANNAEVAFDTCEGKGTFYRIIKFTK